MTISAQGKFIYRHLNCTLLLHGLVLINQMDWTDTLLSDAMTGVAYALHAFIPLFIHCDAKDIHVVPQVKSINAEKPTFYMYDSYPGGIGLSERMYDLWNDLVPKVTEQVAALSLYEWMSCMYRCTRRGVESEERSD